MSRLRQGWTLAVAAAVLATPAAGEPAAPPRTAQLFQLFCAQCHARPGLAAPQLGDEAAWRERGARGMETLLATTVEGRGGMPPLGSCSFCTEQELRDLVALLAGPPPAEGVR